jgi:hypothetical protein
MLNQSCLCNFTEKSDVAQTPGCVGSTAYPVTRTGIPRPRVPIPSPKSSKRSDSVITPDLRFRPSTGQAEAISTPHNHRVISRAKSGSL